MRSNLSGGRVVALLAVFLSVLLMAPDVSEAQTDYCIYDVAAWESDSTLDFGSPGGTSFVWVWTRLGCPYTVQSSQPFVTLINWYGIGTGVPQRIWFSVAPNEGVNGRVTRIYIPNVENSVEVRQVGRTPPFDMNGDGSTDLLWHHRGDGRLGAWLMNGLRRIAAVNLSPAQVPDANWVLAGGGDINGDGHVDLIWRHGDGRVAAWLMNRLQVRSAELLSVPVVADPDWRIRAVFDLNADGRADILWQHATRGLVGIWYMNALQVLDARLVNGPVVSDANWRLVGPIVGTRSHYGSGFRSKGLEPALLWHHDGTGDIALWEMSGNTVLAAEIIGRLSDTNWKLRALPDMNGNGIADFVWQHEIDGRVGVWLDRNPLSTVDLATAPDTGWHVVGPR
jgi:VCBS repeat protein